LESDAVFLWLKEAVIWAYRSLYENAQTHIHYREKVENFLRRFPLWRAMPFMRTWKEYASKKAECKQIAKTAAFNLFRKAISGCMNTWASIVHDKKLAEREMAAKNSHVLLRIMIIKRPMVLCFEFCKEW
jgi:hypothetical protein